MQKETNNDIFTRNNHPALLIVANVPFFIPHSAICVSETSNTTMDYQRYNTFMERVNSNQLDMSYRYELASYKGASVESISASDVKEQELKDINNMSMATAIASSYYSIMNKNLTVNIELSDRLFGTKKLESSYMGLYASLKASINALIYLMERYPEKKWINYVSYFGHRDYIEYGQFTQVAFSNSSNTNLFSITLEIQSYQPPVKEQTIAAKKLSPAIKAAKKAAGI